MPVILDTESSERLIHPEQKQPYHFIPYFRIVKSKMEQNTYNWFKQAIPTPTKRNFDTQYGVHLEEVLEGVEAITVTATDEKNLKALDDFYVLRSALKNVADALKEGRLTVKAVDKQELLDSLCDQHVTATGIAYMAGLKYEDAKAEVDRSNWSKFKDGKAIFDENGKIAKNQETYFKPDLTKFI